MSEELKGKAALITGGSRGIGAAIVRTLAAQGASVAFTYTKGKEPAEKLVKEIEAKGGKAVALQADAADADAVTKAVDAAAKKFGRLDVLVNNAGIAEGGPVEQNKLADFDRMFAVNVRGVFVAIQAALKHLPSGGRIVNIGSCLGERVPMGGITAYSATKGAIRSLTQGLARELGPKGITVVNVQPGPIDTDLNPADSDNGRSQLASIPLGRYGHADEIGALVAFLSGPTAGFITGASITIDGGVIA